MALHSVLGGISVVELLKRTARESWNDEVFGNSARLAFYHFMAIFPALLIVLIPLTHMPSDGGAMKRMLTGSFGQILPEESAKLVVNAIGDLDRNAEIGGPVLMLGAAGAIWAAMNASLAMITGLNLAYETKEDRGWKRVSLTAAALAVAVIGLVFGTLVALHYAATVFGGAEGVLRTTVQWVAVVSILTTSFALFFRFAPNLKEHKWMWSLPGAISGALLWTAATVAMRSYFDEFASYRQIYGRVAPAAMLLLWLYAASAAVLIGAELNSEIAKAREASGAEGELRKKPGVDTGAGVAGG
jgi:membrane protein